MIYISACRLVDNEVFLNHYKRWMDVVSMEKKERLQHLVNLKNKQRTLAGEIIIRSLLKKNFGLENSQVHIVQQGNDKPYLEGLSSYSFNISHSGEWVLGAVSQLEVGIDIEKIRTVQADLAKRFFTSDEYEAILPDLVNGNFSTFFNYWSVKESYLKLSGSGFRKSLDSFNVIFNNDSVYIEDNGIKREDVYVKTYPIDPQYRMALSSLDREMPEIVMIDRLTDLADEILK